MMNKLTFIASFLALFNSQLEAQYWQQSAKYTIDFDLNDSNHQFTGHQTIEYTNNSPDALNRLYFHLYFNAFQPGSAMDVRSLLINDPDPRVGDRISKLSPEECGQMHITSLSVNNIQQTNLIENETILEVILSENIAPGKKAMIALDFKGQVPLQIRRSGRDNAEGIDYSMTQWYPKLCEYDNKGWHPNPYIGREFYGIWGDFDVNITIDKKYIIGGTGELKNACEIGFGYCDEKKVKKQKGDRWTWCFTAKNVHDFAWAADPDYTHTTAQLPNGPLLHFFYQNDPGYSKSWEEGKELVVKGFSYLSEHFGKYPYPQYTVIQGGDGGMEYPMATLITGNRKVPSFVGVVLHEAAHSWYQGVLATNEALYPWMDEGFTSYASSEAFNSLYTAREVGDHSSAYNGYFQIIKEEQEESLDTHADHYITNYAYGTASYNKGEVYLAQLAYVVGQENLNDALLAYFEKWKFKHPTDEDFLHIVELQSNMVLDWYNEYFVHSTKTIDYGIKEVQKMENKTLVTLERIGLMPMPVDVELILKNGKKHTYTIPLDIMRGEKNNTSYNGEWHIAKDWNWVNLTYTLELPFDLDAIASMQIDPQERMADINKENNSIRINDQPIFILKID